MIELTLDAIAHGGGAVGRHQGRVVFVHYGIPGERVRARITQEKERFAHAEVTEVMEASPARTLPPCPHFGPGGCGGCQWQHIDYAAQLAFKQQIVRDQLERIGKFRDQEVLPTIPSPNPWGYRAHMVFSAVPGTIPVREEPDDDTEIEEESPNAPLTLGFYSDDNQRIVPIEECHILHPALLELYEQLALGAPEIERVRLQVGSEPDDRMIVLQTSDDLAPQIEVDFPVSVNLLLSDNEPANLIGRAQSHYRILERAFQVTAGGFFQVNLPMAEILVQEVLRRLAPQPDQTILDLYSGVGLFTAFLAERAGMVICVESYPPAVTDADANLADFENIELIEGAVEDVLPFVEGPIDGVVVDPPRRGLGPEVVKGLLDLRPPRIVYVSCDPATLARDARQFAVRGYRLEQVQPVDMFPQTYHIECVATLSRV
mgnify:CR=1 FL=1